MFRIKNSDHSDHSTLHQYEKTVQKKFQPVKIAELIGSSKKSQNDQANSTVKIISLPEKLTPYLKSASNKKRNDSTVTVSLPEKLTPYLKSASNKKRNETNTHVKVSHSKRNVRRNLNFTKIPSIIVTTGTASTTNKNNLNNSPKEENLHLPTRKSFLLPPNTIKDSYVKDRQRKSILPQSRMLTHSVCSNEYSRLPKKSKSCPSIVRDTNVRIDSCMNSVIHEEVNQTVIQHLSSQMFSVSDKSKINGLNSNRTDMKNNIIEKNSGNLINVEENKCLFVTNNYKKHLHQSAQSVQMINQSCLNLKPSSNEIDEYINLNKTKLTVLASKLKNDIVRLEEDIIPNLKLIFTNITDVLSLLNITTKEIDNSNFTDNKILEQMVENLNDTIEIMNNTNTKSLCMISNNCNTKDSYIPRGVYKTPDTTLKKFVEMEDGKNNSGIQSSCQIDLSSESNKENDSFVNLENKLDITNIKSNTRIISLKKYTPVSNRYTDKKVERPLREYMALKSRMSCLLTPNIKRFSSSQSNNDNLHSESGDAKASLSGKILAELYNLYED